MPEDSLYLKTDFELSESDLPHEILINDIIIKYNPKIGVLMRMNKSLFRDFFND
jgi:hypothetical protein